MIRLTEEIVPQVGKYYLVPHAVMTRRGDKEHKVPIIGSPHSDACFGVRDKHYHIDGRFLSTNGFYKVDAFGKSTTILPLTGDFYQMAVKEVIWIKKKCLRKTTGIYPPPKTGHVYWKWYESFLGKKCKGKKCPHLGTVMHEHGDKLICPLHNLTADIKTEKIIHCQ